MKNGLFQDLMYKMRNQLRNHHDFSAKYGGFMTKKQKEQFKKDFCEVIDKIPEWNGDGYKFPEN